MEQKELSDFIYYMVDSLLRVKEYIKICRYVEALEQITRLQISLLESAHNIMLFNKNMDKYINMNYKNDSFYYKKG